MLEPLAGQDSLFHRNLMRRILSYELACTEPHFYLILSVAFFFSIDVKHSALKAIFSLLKPLFETDVDNNVWIIVLASSKMLMAYT